jgi:hypothetical protein
LRSGLAWVFPLSCIHQPQALPAISQRRKLTAQTAHAPAHAMSLHWLLANRGLYLTTESLSIELRCLVLSPTANTTQHVASFYLFMCDPTESLIRIKRLSETTQRCERCVSVPWDAAACRSFLAGSSAPKSGATLAQIHCSSFVPSLQHLANHASTAPRTRCARTRLHLQSQPNEDGPTENSRGI